MRVPRISRATLDRASVEAGGLYAFGRKAWPIVEGFDLIETWHLQELCRYLESVARFETTRLVINVPPGTGKSSWLCVMFPAWAWIHAPWLRFMFASFDDSLVLRDARKTRKLVESDWYQKRWGPDAMRMAGEVGGAQIERTQASAAMKAGEYWTTAGGLRFSTTIGSKGTGWHCHIQIIDDPHKAKDASGSGLAFDEVRTWYDETMSSRRMPGQPFARVVDMQRLSLQDLSEHCISKGYQHLCYPMRYDSGHKYLSGDDHRTQEGELLCPDLKDEAAVREEELELGPIGRAAQHDQLPSPRGGAVFQRDWCGQYWKRLPEGVQFAQTWDFTFGSQGETASWVVGQKWGWHGGNRYLVSRTRDRVEFPGMKAMVRAFSAAPPHAQTKLVEDKAAGKPLVQDLRNEISGLVEAKVHGGTGGKLARAQATTGAWEAGNVYLPHPTLARLPDGTEHPCPWVGEFVELLCSFRGMPGDVADDVDCMSQMFAWLERSAGRTDWADGEQSLRDQMRRRW